ncbi:unnamed protein product [Peronospora destructor]|uniref:tRNA (guanine(9)-N(1))-methyltransferase n=1 Tax=Peronospora destructor TaxID=86335 RepID=A0AAV0V9K3_9STRA|nr:unnamed protein product [Peronospora destructor]
MQKGTRSKEQVDAFTSVNQFLVEAPVDSLNVLKKKDPEIGSIMDMSRRKRSTLNAATEAGITTVRLPIQENIPGRPDHIVSVNTVVDVLVNFRELRVNGARYNKTKQRAVISDGTENLEAELSPTEDISLWLDDLAG